MPLETGKSRAAFERNVKTELAAGKPKAQALAISYAKQRGDRLDDALMAVDDLMHRFDSLHKRADSLAERRDRERKDRK